MVKEFNQEGLYEEGINSSHGNHDDYRFIYWL